MRYKPLFTVIVRSIGLVLLAYSVPNLPELWVKVGDLRLQASLAALGAGPTVPLSQYAVALTEPIRIAIGLYLLLGGRWIINRLGPIDLPACVECGYLLRGLPAPGQCPECGTPMSDSISRAN